MLNLMFHWTLTALVEKMFIQKLSSQKLALLSWIFNSLWVIDDPRYFFSSITTIELNFDFFSSFHRQPFKS